MKKWIIAIAIVLVIAAAIILGPRFALKYVFDTLPDDAPAEYVTDFDLKEEKTHVIEKDEFVMEVPYYYTQRVDHKNLSCITCVAEKENKKLLIFYKSVLMLSERFDPGTMSETIDDMSTTTSTFQDFLTPLGYEPPDSYFEVVKCISLADKNDFNFWKYKDSAVTGLYVALRDEADLEDIIYIYERGDVRAYAYKDSEGCYGVDITHKLDQNAIYGFVINTDDPTDIIKMLNTFEFK